MQTNTAANDNANAVDASAHLALVKKVARRIARGLPRQVDVDDLIGAGALGLVDAAARFDASRCNFEQYAEIRIRGAILDYLRGLDFMPRSLRARARSVEKARRELGSSADSAAVAARAGVAEGDVVGTRLLGAIVQMDREALDAISVDGRSPGEPIEKRQLRARLAGAIARLPERTRTLLALYYVEEKTLKEIGAAFGVTESRACQLHTQAINKLRAELADDGDVERAA